MQQNKSTMRGILQLLPRAPLWHRVQMIITFSVLLMMGCSVQRWSAFAQQCDPAEEMPDVQGKGKWQLGLAKSPHSHNYIRSISYAQSMYPAQSMDSHAIICGLRVRAQAWILPCARKAWIKTIHGLFCANYGSTLCALTISMDFYTLRKVCTTWTSCTQQRRRGSAWRLRIGRVDILSTYHAGFYSNFSTV